MSTNRQKTKSGIVYLLLFSLIFTLFAPVAAAETLPTVRVSLPTEIAANSRINATITLENITFPIAGMTFELAITGANIDPVYKTNAEGEMDAMLTKAPDGWEQINRYDANRKVYILRFAAGDGGSTYESCINNAGQFEVNVPLMVTNPGHFTLTIAANSGFLVKSDLSTSPFYGSSASGEAIVPDATRFAVGLTKSDDFITDKQVNVLLNIINTNEPSGITSFSFKLTYDKTLVEPVGEIENIPNWTQNYILNAENGEYTVQFTAKSGTSLAKSTSLQLQIPFSVIGINGKTAVFTVSNDSASGTNSSGEQITGKGSVLTTVIRGEEITLVENSTYSITPAVINGEQTKLLQNVREATAVAKLIEQLSGGDIRITRPDGSVLTNNDSVGTGCLIGLYAGDTVIDSILVVVKGDFNGDGNVSAVDYLMIKRGVLQTYTLSSAQLQATAIKGKIEVTASTYLMIKRHVLKTFDIYTAK